MKLALLNPNSTVAMTESAVAAARAVLPEAQIVGYTNTAGPAAIEGPEDGAAALPGLRALAARAEAEGAAALVIACFDDTGLAGLRAAARVPVLGIGQAAYHMAALIAGRFGVVTTLPVSLPVLAENLAEAGLEGACVALRASGLGVLEVEAGGGRRCSRASRARCGRPKPRGRARWHLAARAWRICATIWPRGSRCR